MIDARVALALQGGEQIELAVCDGRPGFRVIEAACDEQRAAGGYLCSRPRRLTIDVAVVVPARTRP